MGCTVRIIKLQAKTVLGGCKQSLTGHSGGSLEEQTGERNTNSRGPGS